MPAVAPKSWNERRYVGVLTRLSRGRVGIRVGELLTKAETFSAKVRVRLWDGREKKWRSARLMENDRIVEKPPASDSRWADIRKDVALERRVFRRELAERVADAKKRRSLAARVRSAKRLLTGLGYVVSEPSEREEEAAMAEPPAPTEADA